MGALGYEDIMNQPRSLTRETRDDGRRYLMWRKITGQKSGLFFKDTDIFF